MSATVFYDIYNALSANLLNANVPTVGTVKQIDRPGAEYTPVEGQMYLRVTHMPGQAVAVTSGPTGQDRHVGLFQVDVFAPLGYGMKDSLQMADNIASQYNRATPLTSGSSSVSILSTSILKSSRSGSWYITPVEIRYNSHAQAR